MTSSEAAPPRPLPRSSGIRGGLAYLREPNFARLFFSRLATQLGAAISPIAIAFGVLELTGSAQSTSIVVAAQATAVILVLLFGGALADRGDRQRILIAADLMAGVSQGLIAVAFLTGWASVPLLALLAAVTGAATGINYPAHTGFVTQVVPRERLQDANALLGLARSSAQTLGFALAGLLVAVVGAGPTIAIEAVAFFLSVAALAGIRAAPGVRALREPMLRSLRLGWREFTAHTWLWAIVLQFCFVVAGRDSFFGVVGPTLSQRMLGGSTDWGLIAASFGVGTLLGGLLALRLRVQHPMRVAVFCVFGATLPMLAMLGPSPVALICAAAIVNGVLAQTFSVLWHTTVQQRVAPDALSRVSAYDALGSWCCAPLGLLGMGFLLDNVDYRATIVVGMTLVIVPTIAALCVRDVWRLR